MNNYSFEILTICRTVENYFNLPEGSIQIKTRKREIVTRRQIAMYFAKEMTKLSLQGIGDAIGKKDHATVLHACKTVNNLVDSDKHFRQDIKEIRRRLTEPFISRAEIFEVINHAIIQRFAKTIDWKNKIKSML